MRANRSTSASVTKAAPLAKAGPFALGAVGVICFSLTFPATTAAERSFSPLAVGAGRSVLAAALAAAILAWRREPLLPPRRIMGSMLVIAATVGVGFGLLSAIALRQVGSVHVAVIAGLIPAATAGVAAWRGGERPASGYWAALALGIAAVIGFAVIQGGGRIRTADLLILIAIAVAGFGYAEGGILAREFDGWRVSCWGVIVALPVSLAVTTVAIAQAPPRHVSTDAVLGLCWVGFVSMCLGFFAWYQGMARGGVAAIGKLQLAQPALTLGWSVLLLGEHVGWLSGAAAAVVVGAAAIGRNAKVGRRAVTARRGSDDLSQTKDQVRALR